MRLIGHVGSRMVPVLNTIGTDVACVGVCSCYLETVTTH